MKIIIPNFATKSELFNYLRENKTLLIQQKKSAMKKADAFSFTPGPEYFNPNVSKEIGIIGNDAGTKNIIAKVVINTTNFLDSHGDVHLPGLWKKSLSEVKYPLHLQEHKMEFEYIIADASDVKVYTERNTWKSLGYDYPGSTEALKHETTIRPDRNPFMHEQYSKGYVRNHSVGMQYVQLFMCVNSEEKWWRDEKDNWDKYIGEIVNRDLADSQGYFWAVKEAKYIEGSSVVMGSNGCTPTEDVSEEGPSEDTQKNKVPDNSTQKSSFILNPNFY